MTGTVAEEAGTMLDVIAPHGVASDLQGNPAGPHPLVPQHPARRRRGRCRQGTQGRDCAPSVSEIPVLKKRLWSGNLWSPSYYVGTAGNVSAETIRRYIERSEHVTKRR